MAYRFISRDIARSTDPDVKSADDAPDVEVTPSETVEIVFDAALASSTGILAALLVGGGLLGWGAGVGMYALTRKHFQR